jgi:hypothetical protein
LTDLPDKAAILTALAEARRGATQWFIDSPEETFFTHNTDEWSASENVDHLIRAVQPVAVAMGLPRFVLAGLFRKSQRSSRSYEEICEFYRGELARGAQASGRYIPAQQQAGKRAGEKKTRLLERWNRAGIRLESIASKWNDTDLDMYRLPHPILGLLTVRETLFFTIYHILRHASLEGD